MDWKGKRVLVTGGHGFIGSALRQKLQKLGAVTYTMDFPPQGVTLCQTYDVRSWEDVERTFQQGSPQVVFHLAAQTEVRKSHAEPHTTYMTNVLGTLNVLEACRRCGVEGCVIASSDKCYGNTMYDEHGKLCHEGQVLYHDADLYSSSKKAADELAQDYGRLYGLPVRVVRCANTYGPGQTNATTLITNTIERLLRGERPVIHHGMDNILREWLYIDDAVEAYLLLAQHACEHPKYGWACETPGALCFNVGSGVRYTVKQVIFAVLFQFMSFKEAKDKMTGCYVDQETVESPQIGNQGLCSDKFRSLHPQWTCTPFDEGIKRTVVWHKEQKR